MTFGDIIKNSVLEGFQNSGITSARIFVALSFTFIISVYIFFVYKLVTRQTFYSKNFNISMAVISLVTCGIILAMQTNLVISLGMVGALSIVRFRTAIKEPMDLLFLFWSISIGIICGAGTYELAIWATVFVSIGLLFFRLLPVSASPYLIVVNADDESVEEAIIKEVKAHTKKMKIDSKNLNSSGMDLIIEVYSKEGSQLINGLKKLDGVRSVSFLYYEGEVKN